MAFQQDPGDILDYRVDWDNVLVSGETISTVTWAGGGLTDTSPTNTTTTATTFLAGGTHGSTYSVVCTITTSASRTYTRRFSVQVTRL